MRDEPIYISDKEYEIVERAAKIKQMETADFIHDVVMASANEVALKADEDGTDRTADYILPKRKEKP
jgi:hypothetical protein